MKKLALILAFSAAAATVAQADIRSGFYAGLAGGISSTAGKSKIDKTDSSATTNGGGYAVDNQSATTTDVGTHSGDATVYLGYGWLYGCTYLAGEIGATITNDEIKTKIVDGLQGYVLNGKYNSDYVLNVSIMPGYKTSASTLVYTRLGVNFRKPKLSFNYTDTSSSNQAAPFKVSSSKNRASFVLGLGIETEMSKNVLFRVEGAYEFGPGRLKVSKTTIDNHSGGYYQGQVALEKFNASVTDLNVLNVKAGFTFKM